MLKFRDIKCFYGRNKVEHESTHTRSVMEKYHVNPINPDSYRRLCNGKTCWPDLLVRNAEAPMDRGVNVAVIRNNKLPKGWKIDKETNKIFCPRCKGV